MCGCIEILCKNLKLGNLFPVVFDICTPNLVIHSILIYAASKVVLLDWGCVYQLPICTACVYREDEGVDVICALFM